MAELSQDVKNFICGLAESIANLQEGTLTGCAVSNANIINNNVFTKFLVIDCKWGKGNVIPSMFSQSVMRNLVESDVQRNIKQLYSNIVNFTNHRGMTSILKYMHHNTSNANGCVKHSTAKGEAYYTYGNILFDCDFNPLLIPCFEIETTEEGLWTVEKIIYKISKSLYTNKEGIDMARKFITTKLVPYVAGIQCINQCYTASPLNSIQSIPVKVEIEDLSGFVCSPMEPSSNFNEEANAILDALVEDILATNA